MKKTITVRFNGHDPVLTKQITDLVGHNPEISSSFPALPDKTLRRVTILEFTADSDEEAQHIVEPLIPMHGIEIVVA